MNWRDLVAFYEGIEAGSTPGWKSGAALEHLFLRCFELDGARVQYPFAVATVNEQLDGALYSDGRAHLVEAKDHDEPLPVDPIAKLRNQLLRRPAGVVGIVVGRSGFTDAARTLASYSAPQAILLWAGHEIRHLLEERARMRRGRPLFAEALARKFRHAVEHAAPFLDVAEDFR